MEEKKETKKLIIDLVKIIGIFTLIWFMFSGFNLFTDYITEKQVKDSNFCQKMNMSYYTVIDNGLASSKIICLDNESNRQEYYYEEAFK